MSQAAGDARSLTPANVFATNFSTARWNGKLVCVVPNNSLSWELSSSQSEKRDGRASEWGCSLVRAVQLFHLAHRRWRAPPTTYSFIRPRLKNTFHPVSRAENRDRNKASRAAECWQWNGDDSGDGERALYFNCSQIGAQKRASGEYYSLRIILARARLLLRWLRINQQRQRAAAIWTDLIWARRPPLERIICLWEMDEVAFSLETAKIRPD